MKIYEEFLKKKQIIDQKSGFEVSLSDLNNKLFDWQKVIVRWALARGRAALFEDCGLGKTCQSLEWANHIHKKENKPILIVAPLAVAEQTKQEGNKFNIPVNICTNDKDVINAINITNYEKLHKFDPSKFIGVVLDECFAPDTPIDIFNIDNFLESKYIKDITVSEKIYNAGGIDYVCGIRKRSIDRAVQVSIEGRRFTCSENHPWFTMYGWRCAKDLQSGDYLMATETAMRLVRDNFPTEILCESACKILRDILLSEMENEPKRNQRQSTQSDSRCQKREEKIGMVKKRKSKGPEGIRKNSKFKSNVKSDSCKEDDQNKNSKWNITPMERQTRRQWQAIFNPSSNSIRLFARFLVARICSVFGKTAKRISDLLQGRYRKPRFENSHRNRWKRAQKQKENCIRSKKRQEAKFIRVDSIEILEQGHPELEKYRDESGIVYFYDIEAKRHPSFSINGCLVHNSSILKNFAGATRNEIIDMFGKTKYRLACTATPAPNDYIELGNHAEFLGIMTRSEMLATFFINDTGDTGTWRLKGHVKNNVFWKWLASWAIMITKPSDIGFEDGDFILPEINYHQHIIPTKVKPKFGFFPEIASTLDERRKVRRETIEIRCNAAADMINSTNDRWGVWCNLNAESELLSKLIQESKEVTGSQQDEIKTKRMLDFANGELKRIVTKPKIAGLGMNWQICNKVGFVGLNDSWEQFYQACRRFWRFGQKYPVDIHIWIEEREGAVLKNINAKERRAQAMIEAMVVHMKEITKQELGCTKRTMIEYDPTKEMRLPKWI